MVTHSMLEKKLDACQQWCLRRLLRISHLQCVTNTDMLRRTNQTQLSTVLCDRCVWLFYMLRCQVRGADGPYSRALRSYCRVTESLEASSQPTQTVMHTNLEKDLSALSISLHMSWRQAQDREQWQRTVEVAVLQHGACS